MRIQTMKMSETLRTKDIVKQSYELPESSYGVILPSCILRESIQVQKMCIPHDSRINVAVGFYDIFSLEFII